MDGHVTHVAVRMVHVLAATVLVGGAAQVAALALPRPATRQRADQLIAATVRYEWAFWPALAILVATGIGNLGAFGEALPGPETSWGRGLIVKLWLVLLLTLLSAPRLFIAVGLSHGRSTASSTLVGAVHGTTSLLGALAVLFAIGIAHG